MAAVQRGVMLGLVLVLVVVGCSSPSGGQATGYEQVNQVVTPAATSPTSTLASASEPVQCDRFAEVSTLWSGSAADWAAKNMGQCADFDGRLVQSESNLHIIGSWDAPYGLDIAVEGSKSCLNAEEHIPGLGTPVSFVARVAGTIDVDDLQAGGSLSIPLVQCWKGNRTELVGWCTYNQAILVSAGDDSADSYLVWHPDIVPCHSGHEPGTVKWDIPVEWEKYKNNPVPPNEAQIYLDNLPPWQR